MILTAWHLLLALPSLVLVAVVVWAVWAVALLSVWTWLAAAVAGSLVMAKWGWSSSAGLDVAAVTLLFGYGADCFLDPRADCWWCRGTPKRRNERRYFHFCLVCGGKGHRRRIGSRLLGRDAR